jgi:DNA polymerase III delta subunit
MIYFLYGDDLPKLNNFIVGYASKNSLSRINFELNSENISEIIGTLGTPNLFGDKNLFIIDITESDPEIILKFYESIKNSDYELIILNEGSIDQRSKVFKSLSNFKTQSYELPKNNSIFNFTDYVISKDIKKTYEELLKLQENKEDDLMIFNMLLSSFRSIAAIKFDSKLKNKIPPFKVSQMNAIAEKYSVDQVKKIIKILAENDLKFKTGEITSEMLLLHSINTIIDNGSSK